MEHQTEHYPQEKQVRRQAIDAERDLSCVAARYRNSMVRREVHRDLGAGVARADDQHAAFAQLLRMFVVV